VTLRDYVYVLRDRWRVIAIFTALSIAGAVVLTITTPKVYEARAQVFVAANGVRGDVNSQYEAAAFVQAQVATLADISTSPKVLDFIQRDLNLQIPDPELKDKLRAAAPTQRALVNIYATDDSPDQAAALANSAARGFTQVIGKYMTPSKGARSTVQLHLTDPAVAPESPISPKPLLNISLGVVLGLLIGIALAVTREVLDTRIKDLDQVAEVAQAPIIGVIAADPKAKPLTIAARASPRSMRAENYRQLRANLQFANVERPARVIAITSSIPGEGKTTIAVNLAWTIAETGSKVCLVDTDLRRPDIATITGLDGSIGLTSLLTHAIDLTAAIQPAGGNLSVLTSGPTPPNPSELLGSATMRAVVSSLAARFEYVIVDAAPLLPVADGAQVAAIADGTVLVSKFKVTTEPMVRRAMNTLDGVEAPVLGVVLNEYVHRHGSELAYTHDRADADQPKHAGRDMGGRRRGNGGVRASEQDEPSRIR